MADRSEIHSRFVGGTELPAKPKSAFPSPAASLPGELDILANVLVDLSDEHAKLVYADWLEERDDPRGPLLRNFITASRAGKKLPAVKSAPESWRNLVGLTLMMKFRETDLAPKTDEILALARPAIAYKTVKAAERTIPVGASKFGGRPDLPDATEWPRFEDQPLSFLGQFNLADLRPSPVARELPGAGVLSAFCLYLDDGDDDFPDGSWRLFYFPDASKLVRHELDAELYDESRFPSCRLEYTEALTLPDHDSPWADELKALGEPGYGETYSDIYYGTCPGDHILGHPYPIQCDILGKKSVRHLLTICGNDETGWEWGDGGALYFTLSEGDLKRGRFDRVKMIMDCG
jgi:uncharacterized protein (TIGR02996 family)